MRSNFRLQWKFSAVVLLVVFVQAIATQYLHVYHQHAEVQLHCDSENEQHIHNHDYAVHHCSLCDVVLQEFERCYLQPLQHVGVFSELFNDQVPQLVSTWLQDLRRFVQPLRGPPLQGSIC